MLGYPPPPLPREPRRLTGGSASPPPPPPTSPVGVQDLNRPPLEANIRRTSVDSLSQTPSMDVASAPQMRQMKRDGCW